MIILSMDSLLRWVSNFINGYMGEVYLNDVSNFLNGYMVEVCLKGLLISSMGKWVRL